MTLNRITSILMVIVLALMVVGLGIWVLGMLAGEASAEGMKPIVLTATGSEGTSHSALGEDGVARWSGMEGTLATELTGGREQELVSSVHLRDTASTDHNGSVSEPNHMRTTQGTMGSAPTATSPAPAPTTASTIHHATEAMTPRMVEPEPHSAPSPTAPSPTAGGTSTHSGSGTEQDGHTSMSPQEQTQPVDAAPHVGGESDGGMHGAR